jgi:hypothetical protein
MAENESDSVQRANETNVVSLDGRLLSVADLYAVAARPDVTRVRIFALKQNLSPLARLTSLQDLELTDDASRKCYEVESLEPLVRLANLDTLTMRGIAPKSGGLEPIGRLTNLRRVDITHVSTFGLEDYARLAAALPRAEGHCLQPVFEAAWAGACPRCGSARVVLTAPPPRTPKTACPICDRERIERHLAAWDWVLSQNT